MGSRLLALIAGIAALLSAGPAFASAVPGPKVDHHQHLLSPAAAAIMEGPKAEVSMPAAIRRLLENRTAAWNDAAKLEPLYVPQAILLESEPVSGRKAVSEFVASRFARAYVITPLSFTMSKGNARLAAMYTRGDGPSRVNVGLSLLTFERDKAGRWRISSEAMKFPAPSGLSPVDSDQLVQMLDQAHIGRAVVLSIAYMFESPYARKVTDAAAKLRAENDWTAAQVGRHPTRLVGFCSVNPLTATAIPEVARCHDSLHLTGLKLHLGNSQVDFRKPDQLAQVRKVFEQANRLRMPIVVHLWNGPEYGRIDAQNFLDHVLPGAPDIPITIAHMAGGGPGWTDEALEVFANAIENGDARTRNLTFDVATVADLQKPEQLELLAKRIRQIGPQRILYGSDAAFGGNSPPAQEWATFRGSVPLTDAEFAVIRDNVAPYLR